MPKRKNSERYYTYVYLDPRKSGNFIYQRGIDEVYCFNHELIYTGKGCDNRINKHIKDASNTNKNKTFLNVIRKIYEEGFDPIRFKILQNVTEEEAFSEEISLISIAGRRDKGTGPLCNETDGGEGRSTSRKPTGRIDISGQKYGRLTAIKFAETDKGGHSKWLCVCECGTEKVVYGTSLKSGVTKSCGCLRVEVSKANNIHGMTDTPIHLSWMFMKNVCNNTNHKQYKDYGNRGITLCERWLKFENFYEDMGNRPSKNHRLGRININGNFELSNCKWMTKKEQNNNKRNKVLLIIDGKSRSMVEWSRIIGTNYQSICSRLNYGWSHKEAVYGKEK